MNTAPDDILHEINKFLCTGEQFNFSCTNKYNRVATSSSNPKIQKYSSSMVVINDFMLEHYHNAWSKCPACKRQNCMSAKCLMYDEESFLQYYY